MSYRDFAPLVVIVGPTAIGKTETSIQLAERFNGEIISADSRLFYRGMDIGTAKPSLADRRRIPHYLIDLANPNETWSLAIFRKAAVEAIDDIISRNKLPFLVGGTGQYIRAVTHGWNPPAVNPNPSLRKTLEGIAQERGEDWLYSWIQFLDSDAASKIDSRNIRRTIRALEVIFTTGKSFSKQKKQNKSSYCLINIGLTCPRLELYARIDARIEAMFEANFLDEVKNLLQAGYAIDLPAMSAIGYRECIKVLQGEIGLEQAKTEMKRTTREYVRRQSNWFKQNDPTIKWFDLGNNHIQQIDAHIRSNLYQSK